jgi:acyl-coenzyme A synthetase/AMP-(fatty) acid ligase
LNLPLLQSADPSRVVVWSGGRAVSVAELLSDVNALAQQLPAERYLVNLCEHRYFFIVAFCAALIRGQTNLLPSSRVPDVVAEVIATNAGSYRCDDAMVKGALEGAASTTSAANITIPADHIAAIAFTSGSTGKPKAHIKRWGSFLQSTPMNAGAIREVLAQRKYGEARPNIVATVPPQHMYGMETSVLLPLAADMAIHEARPLFPADVAAALDEIPEPRVLVTTPVHMRALLASGQKFPDIAVVVSATAPLDASLAVSIEREWRTVMLEMFGSTETCVIAVRHTAKDEAWTLYRGVSLLPLEDSAEARSAWFDAPTLLQDVIETLPDGRFLIRGRNVDMIEVAGKRASLADLTRRLLSVPGVEDGVIFQPGAIGASGVRRVAALVVAPGLSAEAIVEQLGRSVDPVFIPRPLMIVPHLPRNELGKMPRDRLLAALKAGGMEEAR